MRREDQEKINKFSRLHQRELNIEDQLKTKNKEKEELDDISTELELVDEDDKVPCVPSIPLARRMCADNESRYRVGDAFFNVKATKALKMVGAESTKMEEDIGALEDSLSTIREDMTQLKVDLYARFGRSINLET